MSGRFGGAAVGFLAGAAVGVVTALADLLVRAVVPAIAFGGSAALGAAALYVAAWGLLGLGAGLLVAPVSRGHLAGLISLALVVLVGGYVNIYRLPSLFAPTSLVFDVLVLVAGAGLWMVLARRLPAIGPVRIAAASGVVLAVGLAGATLIARAPQADQDQASRPEVTGPNLVVLLLDALRADHTPMYGYHRDTTPHLAALAADGMVFENAYAQSSWTKPSVSTLFTGLYPESHGTHAISSRLPSSLTTLPQVLQRAGYRTAVFAENSFVSPLFGFDRGVDHMMANQPDVVAQTVIGHLLQQVVVRARPLGFLLTIARQANRLDPQQRFRDQGGMDVPGLFADWLAAVDDAPFFAYVHLMKPHAPYIAPAPFDGAFGAPAGSVAGGRVDPPHVEGIAPFATADALGPDHIQALVDNYDERILFGDDMAGQILDAVRACGLWENTAVLVIADHGEEFGEHGLFDHGHSLQEGVVRVPFLLRYPPRTLAGRVTDPVRLLDVPATILDLAGLPPHEQFEGRSVLALPEETRPRPVLAQLQHGVGYWSNALISRRMKLVQTQMGQRYAARVFDLMQDPGEDDDLAVAGAPPLTGLELEMEDAVLAAGRQRTDPESVVMDPETEERLRALGYIR